MPNSELELLKSLLPPVTPVLWLDNYLIENECVSTVSLRTAPVNHSEHITELAAWHFSGLV